MGRKHPFLHSIILVRQPRLPNTYFIGQDIFLECQPITKTPAPRHHQLRHFRRATGAHLELVDYDVAFLKGLADGLGGVDPGRQVRLIVLIDGG